MFYLSDLIILYKTLHFLGDCSDKVVERSKCFFFQKKRMYSILEMTVKQEEKTAVNHPAPAITR